MALAYLLSPTFEIVNSAGKPATGGFIEVYVAGSRNKYYCASDFDGTLHPFRIPLDSLGSNIVLAEDTGAYDVYVYNRYGTLLMSRYNVKPGGGGTLAGTITSSDGSISVTPTSTGVDLRVDLEAPSILRATAQSLTGDGLFQFSELQRDGRGATVDVNGRVMLSEGWWHYDATVRLRWPGNPAESGTQSISLYTANGSDSMPFDLSYAHSDTVQINGEFKSATSGTQFILGVLGIPAGLTVELVDFGIHSILGEGAANGRYYAGNGIQINEADRIVSVDTDVVQEKLTAGTAITITDNVISAVIPPQEQADWTEDDTSASSYIQHKPDLSVYATGAELTAGLATKQDVISDLATIRAGAAAGATAVQDDNYVHTDNNFTNADATKLSGIAAGAEVNVQSDWDVTDTSSDAYIANKPTIPPALSAGNGIDITNNVVSVDLDGASLTNGANGLSVTLPVPDTASASQGDVLAVGQNGIEWITPTSDMFFATYGTTTFSDIRAAHNAGKMVFLYAPCPNIASTGYLLPLSQIFLSNYDSQSFARFNGVFTNSNGAYGYAGSNLYRVTGENAWSTEYQSTITVPGSSDVGKVYKATTNGRASWDTVNEVPASTTTDENKVLTVNSSGNAEWATVSIPVIGTITL